MKFILGKKINMTQVWDEKGQAVAVTRVQAGPCIVTQVKDEKNDGYQAVQIAYDRKKVKNVPKPVRGHLKKAGFLSEDARFLREFRTSADLKPGDVIDVSTFDKGDIVDVQSVSKGKGFQGVVKRYGFAGSQKTHGNKDQLRATGSIGALGPSRVFKGKKMPGRMGGDTVTIKNLEIIEVDLENNILFIKGAVPGYNGILLKIKGAGDLVVNNKKEEKEEKEDKKEEKEVEAPVEEDKKEE